VYIIDLEVLCWLSYRSVKCIEINKESKASFEKTIERLPSTVDSSITCHHADASKVSTEYLKHHYILCFLLPNILFSDSQPKLLQLKFWYACILSTYVKILFQR